MHTGANRLWTVDFIAVCATGFLVFLSFYSLMGILPLYILHVGGSLTVVGLLLGLFTLTAVGVRPFTGRWLDRTDRRRVLGAGLLIIAVSFGAYGVLHSLLLLALLRVLHGVGWALTSTAASTMVADVAPPTRRGEAMGYYSNMMDIAMAVGPLLAVVMVQHAGYALTFEAGGVVALLAFLPLSVVRRTARPPRAEAPAERPFFARQALLPALVMGMATFSFGAVVSFLPTLAERRGLSAPVLGISGYAWFYFVYAVCLLLVRGPVGRLTDRFGRGYAIVPGLLLLAAGTVLLAVLRSFPLLILFAALYAAGFGSSQPALLASTVDRTPKPLWGSSVATFFAAFDLGIGAATLILGPVAQFLSYRTAFLADALFPLLGLLLYVLAGRRRPRIGQGGSPV